MRKKSSIIGKLDSSSIEINLTPLIDVVFVVLIIFILIAPMLELDRVKLAEAAQYPTKEHSQVKENSPVVIHIHEDNTILLNFKPIRAKDLVIALKEVYKKNPNPIPQLFPDKHSSFGTYQIVKNAVECSGFEELDVILRPEDK